MSTSKQKNTQISQRNRIPQTKNYIKFTFNQINDFNFEFQEKLLAKLSIKYKSNGKIQDLTELRQRITQDNKNQMFFKYDSNRMICKQYNEKEISSCHLILQVQVAKFATDHKQNKRQVRQNKNQLKQMKNQLKQVKKDLKQNQTNKISIKKNLNTLLPIKSKPIQIPLQKFLTQSYTNHQLKVDMLYLQQTSQRLCSINLNIISLPYLKYYLLIKQVSLKTQIFEEKYVFVVNNQMEQVRIQLRMNQWHSYQASEEKMLPMVLGNNMDHLNFIICKYNQSANHQQTNTPTSNLSQSKNQDHFQFNIQDTIFQGINENNNQGIKMIQTNRKQSQNSSRIKPITKTIQQLYQQEDQRNGYKNCLLKFHIDGKQSYVKLKLKLIFQSKDFNSQQ